MSTDPGPTEQGIRTWYNRRYAERGADGMRTADAYPVFLDDLGVRPGKTLLDIACGSGYLLLAAAKRGLRTYGVDISDEAVSIAKRVSPESGVSVGKGEKLPFPDDMFDYVSCLGSLEHFLDMEKGLSEMKRVAKPDALFIIMVPNSDFLYWRLSGKVGTEQQDINEHLMTLRQWRELLEHNGLRVVHIRQDRWPIRSIRPFAAANPLKVLKGLAFKLVWSLLPLRYAYQFVFILRKARPDGRR